MLACSWDLDQDLKPGSKLFTWHDVCCIIRGDFVRGDYVLVVKFRGGGRLCPSCKIQWGGDYVLVVKFSGGIMS